MFYYPTVLQRHSGCFATIWLVATKGISVPRRDILKVNVVRTCDDIIEYVLEKVPPPRPDLPRPRFSLYLSSQLQYGVIVVYHRQCALFLEELQTFLNRLVKNRDSQRIDLGDKTPALLLKDALTFIVENEGAPDPLFGMMHSMMPSPRSLIEMERSKRVSPGQSELTSTSSAASLMSDFTVPPESITLRETQEAALPAPEFEGAELPEGQKAMVDFLLEQDDYFTEGDSTEKERREKDLEQRKEITTTSQNLQHTVHGVEENTQLPQEELGHIVDPPGSPTMQLIHESHPSLPPSPGAERRGKRSLELQEAPPEVKKKKKKQLIFFDTETQLPDDTMLKQLQDPLIETRRPLLLPRPSHLRIPAAELFRTPCTFLSEDVLSLWRRAATITPVSDSDLQVRERPESTDSEKDREIERTKRQEEQEGSELQSDASLPPLEGSIPHEASRDILPMEPSEKEASVSSRPASLLEDIPEVMDESAQTHGIGPILPEDLTTPVSFQSLLPPNASRRTVCKSFRMLLGILETRALSVEQTEPYGDIVISPGVNYQSVQL